MSSSLVPMKTRRIEGNRCTLNMSRFNCPPIRAVRKFQLRCPPRHLNMIQNCEFFFNKGENASQVAEIADGVYGANTVTANYVQFWVCRPSSGTFDVKDAPRIGRSVVENVGNITEIFEVYRLVSSRSIAQGLKIDHKTVLSHLRS
ncbi:histone-lysine N-methyltransferase SETMAR [Trichonephila clavipes]|nr:histone-lysine N-methyltransferase SETMAR [Trichonephila clavipes]